PTNTNTPTATNTPSNPDFVVYRVGTGSGTLNGSAAPVFLDEYTASGQLVRSVVLPTTTSGSQHRLVASGSATSEGQISRSADGRYILLTGYDAAVGTASIVGTDSTTNARVIGRVDAAGSVDTSTALSDAESTNNVRSATSTNGTDLWVSGTG